MRILKNTVLPIFIATIWISLSEFVRNEILFKSFWTEHYDSLGMVFPSEPLNGIVWGIWSLLFAIAIYIISRRFTFFQTLFISWFVGFVLMWVVVWNLAVLPLGILWFAIPLSLLEAYGATFIIKKLSYYETKSAKYS
jgi:hypothetical protein